MSHSNDNRWLDRPETHKLLWRGLFVVCAGLVAGEFFVHGHPHFGFDGVPAFNGVFGFVAFVVIVKLGELLRRFVMKPEDYYDPREDA